MPGPTPQKMFFVMSNIIEHPKDDEISCSSRIFILFEDVLLVATQNVLVVVLTRQHGTINYYYFCIGFIAMEMCDDC